MREKAEWLPASLTGPRVLLRPLSESDAKAVVSLMRHHPNVTKNFTFFNQDVTVEREAAYIRSKVESPNTAVFAIMHTGTGNLLGTCGLEEITFHNGHARLGYILLDASQHRKGFMREACTVLLDWAFEEINFHKLYLNVFPENTAGRALDESLGFQKEGCLREHYNVHGIYHDVLQMSLLQREWRARQKKK